MNPLKARIAKIKKNVSSIWFGARQTGKSTLIKGSLKGEKTFIVDLLDSSSYRKYLLSPEQFRPDVEYQIKKNGIKFVVVDEIQKLPLLTNEIHFLIEAYKKNVHFILSGSSARKLKRGEANLLGGRAILCQLFPLTMSELGDDFILEDVLQYGSLAGIYFETKEIKILKLKSYIDLYLKEEIAQEGLVRNFELFNRFFDIAGVYAAEIINYSNIARESSTSHKTVKSYFEILSETLIGYELQSWDVSVKRQLSKHPKFYFVDNGILNSIVNNLKDSIHPVQRGKLFEQWIINETRAYLSYHNIEIQMYYWRTERGEFEVDLLLAKGRVPKIAIEIKAKKFIAKKDLSALIEITKEFPKIKSYCLYEGSSDYEDQGIEILNYKHLINILDKL
jgi:predicted AAA+ superfamily ATPase